MKSLQTERKSERRKDAGYTLMEALIAAVVFTGVFLVILALQSKAMANLSGSDTLRVSQLADGALARFLSTGHCPRADSTIAVDEVKYRMVSECNKEDRLTKLKLTFIRVITGDTIATFYTERFSPQTGQ